MQEPRPDRIFVGPEDEPLVLTGPPARLAGRLALRNPTTTNLVLRDAGLRDPTGMLFARQLRRALPTLVLRPEQGRTFPLSVAVDPTTPPGEYQVELDLAGQSRPAVLQVTEVFSFTSRPDTFVVENRPGLAQRKRIVVTNTGNVTFTIGDIGEVDLKDDLAWERAIRIAVEPWSDRAEVEIEKIVVAVLEEVRRRDERAGSLVVSSPGGSREVRPGETAAIDLDITVGEGLPGSGRFRGRAPLLTQDLEVVVVASGASTEGEPPSPAAESTGKRPRARSRKAPTSRSEQGESSGGER
jgi:hypothetical protein